MQTQEKAHFNMLEQQVRPTDMLDETILGAMAKVKRADFVDDSLKGLAYADTSLPMGYGQVMLPPILQSKMLEAIAVQPTESVLEIGTGTGYMTALLALQARQVTTVESVQELSAHAEQLIAAYELHIVTCCVSGASKDWDLADRVDVIVSSAAAVMVPESYKMRLNVGGRLVATVGEQHAMQVQLIERVSEKDWQTTVVLETKIPHHRRFVETSSLIRLSLYLQLYHHLFLARH